MSQDVESSDDSASVAKRQRDRIAGRIHDDLIPYLFVASAALEQLGAVVDDSSKFDETGFDNGVLESAEAQQRLTQAHRWVRDAMHVARDLLDETLDGDLTSRIVGGDWVSAAACYIAELFPSESRVKWPDVSDLPTLNERSRESVYQTICEAVRNAIIHSGATAIVVSVCADAAPDHESQTVISVTDDGRGFDPQAVASSSRGIAMMRRRVQSAGGQLRVDTAPGGPTTISLVFSGR